MKLGQLFYHHESQTESPLPARPILALNEELENIGQRVPGDPDAIVRNVDNDGLTLLARCYPEMAALLGVMGRVAQ